MLIGARELGLAVLGIAGARRGWSPKDINNISDSLFRTIHCIKYKIDFQIQQWFDKKIVTMITKFHTP